MTLQNTQKEQRPHSLPTLAFSAASAYKKKGGLSFVSIPLFRKPAPGGSYRPFERKEKPASCFQEAGCASGPCALAVPGAGQGSGALHLRRKGMKVSPGLVTHGAQAADTHFVGDLVERGAVGQLLLIGAALEAAHQLHPVADFQVGGAR